LTKAKFGRLKNIGLKWGQDKDLWTSADKATRYITECQKAKTRLKGGFSE
jgi:hypothetical protein